MFLQLRYRNLAESCKIPFRSPAPRVGLAHRQHRAEINRAEAYLALVHHFMCRSRDWLGVDSTPDRPFIFDRCTHTGYAYINRHADADQHADTDEYTDFDAHPDQYADPDGDAHPDEHTHSNDNPYADEYAHPDSNADPYLGGRAWFCGWRFGDAGRGARDAACAARPYG